MRPKHIIAGLLAAASIPSAAQAQTGDLVYNAKPDVTRATCDPQAVYDLVPSGAVTSYRATKADAPGGFDPAGTTAVCGSVTRATQLTCVTSTGQKAADQSACEPAARTSYERRNRTTVHRSSASGFDYYTAETRTVGSAPLVSKILVTTDIVGTCMQIAELEAYSNGVNVALASRGAVVNATPSYDGSTQAYWATDGAFDGIYHSRCDGGNHLIVDLPAAVRLDRLVIYGRNDQYGGRDVFGYKLLNGAQEVASGQIDARNKTGTAELGGSCTAQTFEWRSTLGECVNGTAPRTSTCHDADTGAQVDASRCNATMRPGPTSTCTTQTAVTSIPEVRVGWCGYTSSGGGRYACGPVPDTFVRTGQLASWPFPGELCTGNRIKEGDGVLAGKNWVNAPVTEAVPGARCVIQMKAGYSGHWERDRPSWVPIYYDGPPTGHPGGTYIRKKP